MRRSGRYECCRCRHIASASFILISVNSFRKGAPEEGFGGYAVLAESLVPIATISRAKRARRAGFDRSRVRSHRGFACVPEMMPVV